MADSLFHALATAVEDRYEIERELAPGGMSRVFLARDTKLGRQVVVKVLPPSIGGEVGEARFKREVAITAALQHPNILSVLSAGAQDGVLYYITPHVAGESLRHWLDREPLLPVGEVTRILMELLDALDYAHRLGVVHRDIKPENILLVEGHPLLADFGIACGVPGSTQYSPITGTGIGLGTPGYMAPEQLAGDEVDGRADLFAVAAVGYEMLTGRPAFRRGSHQETLAAYFAGDAQPISIDRAGVPHALANALSNALARDPARRTSSATTFRSELSLGGEAAIGPIPARRASRLPVLVAVAAAAVAVVWLFNGRREHDIDPDLVAIAPFSTPSAKHRMWKEGLVDILARTLDGSGQLRTVAPSVVIRQWKGDRSDVALVAALANRVGAAFGIAGEMLASGADSVRIRARLVGSASGKPVGGDVEVHGSLDAVDRLTDSLAVALLREVARIRPLAAVRVPSLSAHSIPALKAFLRGEQFYRRALWDSAAGSFREAVALDTTFAVALRRLGQVEAWRRSTNDSLTRSFFLRAGAHNRETGARDSLLITADSIGAAATDHAVSNYWPTVRRLFSILEETVRLYPSDPEARFALADAHYHFAYGGSAEVRERDILEEFKRAIVADSAFSPSYAHTVELSFALDGSDSGMAYVRQYLALGTAEAQSPQLQLISALFRARDSAQSARAIAGANAETMDGAFLLLARSSDSAEWALRIARTGRTPLLTTLLPSALAYRGRFEEALALAGRRRLVLAADGLSMGVVSHDAARAILEDSNQRPTSNLLQWWAANGDTAAILHYSPAIASPLVASNPLSQEPAYRSQARQAYLDLARRDTVAALVSFARLADTTCMTCLRDRVIHAQLLAARGDAERAFAILNRRVYSVISPVEVGILFRRARMAESTGRNAEAVTAYRRVMRLWSAGDALPRRFAAEAAVALRRLGGSARR